MTEPRTQDLPSSINIPEGGFTTKLFEDLLRSVKTEHRRDCAALRFVISPETGKKYKAALVARGVFTEEHEYVDMRYGPCKIHVDETLGDDVILIERRSTEGLVDGESTDGMGRVWSTRLGHYVLPDRKEELEALRDSRPAPVEPCCERDHNGDGDCDRHPAPRGRERIRRVDGELSVTAKPVRIAPRATLNEVKGLAEHSKVQNATRKRVNFGAERNILGSHVEVVLDGARLGTVTCFNAIRELDAIKRKVRKGDSDGKLTVPGWGNMGFDKVNSAWAQFIEANGNLSGLTMRVTVADPGMPNDETTEYTGVTIRTFADMTSLGDIVTQAVEFTFLDSEVIQPVQEPANDALYELWEYRWADGTCREKPDSLIPA